MSTIDLSNHLIIKNNQESSCQISAMVALHGIDLAETQKSLILTTLSSISTTIQVEGYNLLGYTGYAIINDEIVYVNSSVVVGGNTSLSISRALNGTVAQTLSTLYRDYIYPVNVFFLHIYDHNSKTDISDSDLWGYSIDNCKCQIVDNSDNWNYFNSGKLYNKYINKEIFIFEGVNNQFVKTYEGVTTKYNTDSSNIIEIEFSDSSAKTYNEDMDSNKYYNEVTLKEMLEDIYPEQRVQYVADTNEANYPTVKYLSLGDFEKYSSMLSYLCKQFAVRIVFRKNNTIFIFSDVMQENLIAQEDITAFDIVDITDNSSGQLVINDAEGTYIYRKPFVNEEDYDSNNKYTKWNFNKTLTGSYTVLNNSIWKEVSFTLTATELAYISYENYVMLQDVLTGNEYIGKPSSIDITTGELKVIFGTDKYSYWDELGRLEHLSSTITLTNPILYYSPDSKPIIAKFALDSDGETIDSNLKFPIVAGEEHLFYLNFSASTTNDNEFTGIALGNYVTTEDSRFNATNGYADNTYLKFGKEYYQNSIDFPVYLYSSKIDTNYNDRIAISTLNNEDISVKTEWSDDSEKSLKVTLRNDIAHNTTEYTVFNVADNIIKVSSATYNAITVGNCLRLKGLNTGDIGYSTYLNYKDIIFCVTSKSNDGTNYYLTLDTKYPDMILSTYLSFNIITKATKHSITNWVSQSSLEVSSTTYNTLKVGDCLRLAGILSSDTRYDRYLEYKEARWLVVGKLEESGTYYIYLNTDYPRKYSYPNFDFIRFPREQVILINEFYIRGNPVMQYTNSYLFDDEESKKLYGSKKYSLDGKNLTQENFSKIAGYVFKTYAGTNTTNMRSKLEIELPCRMDLEVGNIISLTDSVATKYYQQKCMIIGKSVNYAENGRTEKYTLLTIGDYSTSTNSINISSTSGYNPVVIPSYSHTGGEGTSSQTTNQNISNKTVILYDDTQGTITIQEIDASDFCAYVNLVGGISADSLSVTIPIDGITVSDTYRSTLLRLGAEGVIKVNNEYIAYRVSDSIVGDSVNLVTEKRGLGSTSISAISDNQKIRFYKILSKISADGIMSNEILLGNGVDNYVKVTTENGVEIVGSVTITSGGTYDDLKQYTNTTDAPNGALTISNSVTTGTATADGNVIVDVPFSYTQSTWIADNLLIYVKEGGGAITSTDKNYSTSTTATSMSFLLKPNTTYIFGIQATRTVKSGNIATAISSSNTITTINSNYTANIDGNVASTVVSNANLAFTGTTQYRDGTSPSKNATFGTITTTATEDGNVVVNIPFSYTQGTYKASHILVYYKENGGTVVSTDPCIIVPATSTGNVTLTLKPSLTTSTKVYSFGLQAVMTTASGYASYATILSSSNYNMPVGNYKGLLQSDNSSNFMYQNTTVKLGKNAISSGNDGMYVGNTAYGSSPTNYIAFNTTAGTFDLKSTGKVNISNTGNELLFDSATSADSYISMNNGSQQIGKVTGLTGITSGFNGIFVGDKNLNNNQYMYYDGISLNFKGKYFNGVAYCDTVDDFIGALHGHEYIYKSGGVLNPYYGKDINGIVLTNTTYTIPSLTTYPFGDVTTIIPQQSISFITSLGGLAGNQSCNLDFANKNLTLEYDIEISNMLISGLGHTSGGTALRLASNGVTIKDIKFIDLNGYIDGESYGSSYMSNIRIVSFTTSNTSLIKNARNLYNITILADNLSINDIKYFDNCLNINNVYVFNSGTTNYNLSKVTIFYVCSNIANVFLYNNYYKRIAKSCVNINNLFIYEPISLSYTINSYYFYYCSNLNNIKFQYQDIHVYKFQYCDRIINCDGSYKRDSLSICTNDINNSWNIERNIVSDTLLPTSTYDTYPSKLTPQLLHIYIKNLTTRYVTSGVDLDIDNSVLGNYGLYKFIYNNSLSRWELHQLTQSRDIDSGDYVYINFSTSESDVFFNVKSKLENRYITILAEEIK